MIAGHAFLLKGLYYKINRVVVHPVLVRQLCLRYPMDQMQPQDIYYFKMRYPLPQKLLQLRLLKIQIMPLDACLKLLLEMPLGQVVGVEGEDNARELLIGQLRQQDWMLVTAIDVHDQGGDLLIVDEVLAIYLEWSILISNTKFGLLHLIVLIIINLVVTIL